jgi:Heavy metal associated domain 2
MYEAHVVHHIPGRMRIKLPFLKGASAHSQQINDLLMPVEGLRQVDFNPITGSVLLHYDPEKHEHFSKHLTKHVQDAMGLNLVLTTMNGGATSERNADQSVTPVIRETKLAREISKFFTNINQNIKAATDDVFDLKSLLPVGLGVYALLKAGSGMTTPLWVTLGIFSFTSFAILNPVSITVEADEKQTRSNKRKKVSRRSKRSR